MTDDNYKKLAGNLFNKVQSEVPKEECRKDSVDDPARKITNRGIRENSITTPPKIGEIKSQTQTVMHLLNKIEKK